MRGNKNELRRPQHPLMKNIIPLFICICIAFLVLVFRSAVHEGVDYKEVLLDNHDSAVPKENELQIHFHERRPFYVSYKGKVYGLVANPISLALTETGMDYVWVETPAKRQLDIIRENKFKVCAAGWFKTPEREQYAKFTLPVYQDKPFVALTRASNGLLKTEDSIDRVFNEDRLRLLVKSGYSYGTYLDAKIEMLSPRQVITTAENEAILKMILAHRADYCFMTEEEAHDLLVYSSLNRLAFKVVHFKDIPENNQRYLICSKKVTDEDIHKINGALNYVLKGSTAE